MDTTEPPRFNGPYYDPAHDDARLINQHERIKHLMLDGVWRTLTEIASLTRDPEASISAQLRHLRKKRFGSWTVETRSRGHRDDGLYEYRLVLRDPADQTAEDPVPDRPRLTKGDWRAIAEELPLIIAAAEHQGHVTGDAIKKLVAYAAWSARPRSYPRRDSNPQSPG